jgi:hypothetical protein
MIRVSAISLEAARRSAQAAGRWRLARTLALALVTLAAGGVAAVPAHSSPSASALEREALAHAQVIRAEVTARYRHAPGRKLAVTEATPTGVVESITLITDWLEPWRVVPAGNGIYFAICSVRATCPYPAPSAVWPAEASLPRRIALELAVRTLLETSVNLVVVALPTARPTWVVVERDDLQATVDAPAVLNQLASNPVVMDTPLRELVDRLTRPRLFLPLPILPPPDDTIYAVRLFGPD